MKLRAKLSLLVLLPILALGTVILLYTLSKVREMMEEQEKQILHSTAISAVQAYRFGINSEYHRLDDGSVWIGNEINISENSELVDNILKETGIVSTFFYGDERIMTSIRTENGERAIGTKASAEVANTVLTKGTPYFSTNLEILGVGYYAYYYPIYQIGSSSEIIGMFFVGSPQQTVLTAINDLLYVFFMITTGMTLLCFVIAFLSTNTIISPLKKSIKHIESLAEGNLKNNILLSTRALKRRDEIGSLNRASNTLLKELRNIIGSIVQQSKSLSKSSASLSTDATQTAETMKHVDTAVNDISQGALSQAEETQNASTQMIHISSMIENTSSEVELLTTNANAMNTSSNDSSEILTELMQVNEKAKTAIHIIYDQTHTTHSSAVKIQQATNLITAIAKETNILSLNASIEAARAGEHGKGFSVVADQIQKLAAESNSSAKMIEGIIQVLIQDSNKAVEIMDEVKQIIDRQINDVTKTKTVFTDVQSKIIQSLASISKISTMAESLNKAKFSIVDSIQNLSAIAEENAASCEETAASTTVVASTISDVFEASITLQEIAKELEKTIAKFQL